VGTHRTTARGALLLLLLLAAAASAAAAPVPPAPTRAAATTGLPTLVFPVVGPVSYVDDFGDPRGGGVHEGNDLMAPKRSPAVAVEAGTVKFWTTSKAAGCMLYLYGDSGTTYLYIHLNNDVTLANDNRGKCVPGTAYAPRLTNGARVAAGQPVGLVGDSGDANGIASHLHFEVHPKDGKAVDPFPYLKKATRLLVAAPAGGTPFTLKLVGTVAAAAVDQLDMNVATLQAWPSHLKLTKVGKTVALTVPPEATVLAGSLDTALPGQKVAVWTLPAFPSLAALTGEPGALSVEKVELR
jgi:peptidase M23-like protein